jgi:hypothetical protein
MVPILSLALLCSGSLALPLDISDRGFAEQDVCLDDDRDCIDGHISLLQESASLHKHRTGKESALTQTARSSVHAISAAWWKTIAVVVLAAAAFYFLLILPVRRRIDETGRRSGRRPSFLEAMMVDHAREEEIDERSYDSLDEDTYSLALALIVRDLHSIDSGQAKNRNLRYSRIGFSIGLILMTVAAQVSVLICVQMYVTPQQIADIRDAYAEYEEWMYDGHVYLNENGKSRGIDGYFDASLFETMDDDLKSDVCNIPMSELPYLCVIILAWAIMCLAQIKSCIEKFCSITFMAKTIDSMKDSLFMYVGEDNPDEECDDGVDTSVVCGCTLGVKVFLALFVFLPDLLCTCFLLWLGTMWLTATNDFGNLLSNAVALDFVLGLKFILCYALVSDRNKRDLDHTGLAPSWKREPAGFVIYFNTLTWAFFAFLWVWLYIQNQGVLPDYKWDVNIVCNPWLASQLDPPNEPDVI